MTIVVLGAPEQVESYSREQHLRDYVQTYEWSKPQPAPNAADKVIVALNRMMS
ncbi:hypothetical protein IFO70_19075 [Phormidium tenue FACHB-886]|nr:hypothetical protein [Phormidium tenue FACHB-886]